MISAPPTGDAMCGGVDDEPTQGDDVRGGEVVGLPQPGSDTSHEFLGLEGFGDVVVGPRLQPGDDVCSLRTSGEHDDRYSAGASNVSTHLDSVAAGQHEVEQDEVGAKSGAGVDGVGTVVAPVGEVSLPLQNDLHHLGEGGVIVDDEHPSGVVLRVACSHSSTSCLTVRDSARAHHGSPTTRPVETSF